MAQHLGGAWKGPVDHTPDTGVNMAVKRVLAVENNELVLSFIESSLGTAGYEVDTALNGREALAKIDRETYDAIISDVRMPDVDGLELCRELERRCSAARQRLVFLTSLDTVDEHHDFFEAVGVPTLTKPIGPDDLQETLEQLIGAPDA